MKEILNINKPIGLSPLDVIKILKETRPELKNEPMTYAGRLDPMARGVLLILAGESILRKDDFLKLDKEYEAEILFGFETDTFDILGIPAKRSYVHPMSIDKIKEALKGFEGETSLPLPPFSSYRIKGKPLFRWAREGKLGDIEIPVRKTQVYEIKLLDFFEMENQELKNKIIEKINLAKGDFRQKEILDRWQKMLPNSSSSIKTVTFWMAKIKISCSSGTYVRSIAHHLGQKLETGGVLLSLIRTKVGEFRLEDSILCSEA
ncbi:hypothetical protein C4572_03875 [Candidatus Parcubacteria bacterium]|nr:MAG: hypothetical protein C4572_03875 [Candidatus Parcubacteria bacterium]